MEIREINNKSEWEAFLKQIQEKTFLQSWNWGEFNLLMKNKIWRLGIYSQQQIIGVALVIKVLARRGTFLFIPHGPVMLESLPGKDKKEILEILLTHLREIASQEDASFIRISPLLEKNQENQNIFDDMGFRRAPMHSSAYEATWKLDICPKEESLLMDMRKTTRYLIKKVADNKDISIEISSDPKNIRIYQQLNKELAKRQNFVGFSDNFIKNEFEVFNQDKEAVFVLGRVKDMVIAGAIIVFWSGQAFYHQAASMGDFAKLSVPYLLQWEAVKEAKRRDCKVYDFWGFTDPEKLPKHPWAGPTLFKMGFGGYKKEYIKTQDFVISKKYWINYIIERFRRIKRGL